MKASSAKILERMMLQNNLKRRAWHNYQISFCQKDGMWYAWYYVDLSGSMNQEINEIQTGG